MSILQIILVLSSLFILYSNSSLVVSPFVCNTITGITTTDPSIPSIASCPSTQTLTSCGTKGSKDLWGTYINPLNPNDCITNTESLLSPVTAVAVCCSFPEEAIKSVITIESVYQQNLKVVTDCPSNSILTGCQINRQSGNINQIRGTYSTSSEIKPKSVVAGLNHNQCIGQAAASGVTLRGGAQCIQTNDGYELDCISSKKGVECPLDYELVSCMAWTLSTGLEGWYYTNDGSCYIGDDPQNNVYQNGICCRLKHAYDHKLVFDIDTEDNEHNKGTRRRLQVCDPPCVPPAVCAVGDMCTCDNVGENGESLPMLSPTECDISGVCCSEFSAFVEGDVTCGCRTNCGGGGGGASCRNANAEFGLPNSCSGTSNVCCCSEPPTACNNPVDDQSDSCPIPTGSPTTAEPTTAAPTTSDPTTAQPTTSQPSQSPSTQQPTTADPTTADPTTAAPTTADPTTAEPTSRPPTSAPSTQEPTTADPTTADPTTAAPTTADPTTADPTTANPTTADPTTADPTTADPTTSAPTTSDPTTADPTTADPTTAAPTTADPTTANPTTAAPTTADPTTADPTTADPTTAAPTTSDPTTASPTTADPTTADPTTADPTTADPTTADPTTATPTTANPTTAAPVSPGPGPGDLSTTDDPDDPTDEPESTESIEADPTEATSSSDGPFGPCIEIEEGDEEELGSGISSSSLSSSSSGSSSADSSSAGGRIRCPPGFRRASSSGSSSSSDESGEGGEGLISEAIFVNKHNDDIGFKEENDGMDNDGFNKEEYELDIRLSPMTWSVVWGFVFCLMIISFIICNQLNSNKKVIVQNKLSDV